MRLDPAQDAARLYAQGRLAEAEALFCHALERDPASAAAALGLAQIALDVHREEDALKLADMALRLHPRQPALHLVRAGALAALGRWDETILAARRAAALDPTLLVNALTLEGMALRGLGRLDEAEGLYRRALESRPDTPEILNNLAEIALERRHWDEAEAHLDRALALRFDLAPAWTNRARLAGETDRLALAAVWAERATSLDPRYAKGWGTLGAALADLGQDDQALAAYERALALAPDDADLRFNRAIALLRAGDFAPGWAEWRHRFAATQLHPSLRRFPQPIWDGEPLDGRRLLLWGEQGPGDAILFASMIPDLLATRARVTIEAQPRLVPLFARSFPEALVVARADPPAPETLAADVQSAIGDLGRFFRPDRQSFDRPGGTLKADFRKTSALRQRYGAPGMPLIGLAWGSLAPGIGGDKSIPPGLLAPILAVPGLRFVSLQYASGDAPPGVIVDTEIDQMRNMDDFAAQVAALDLVISVSATAVHVAGGLGVPVWTLLPHARGSHWYWFRGEERGLWYPSQRLFRQKVQGQWKEVIARVAEALRHEN